MTNYDPEHHHRRSIRLKGYDYTRPGAYFITICTHERAHLFGAVVDGVMRLNAWGEIVRDEWFKTAKIRTYVTLYPDEFVVMPNHVHGIIWIMCDNDDMVRARRRHAHTADDDMVGARRRRAPTGDDDHVEKFGAPVPGSIPTIIRSFKSAVAKRINALRRTPGEPVWQRNYYEHIIRTERALDAVRGYIFENPMRWQSDRYNPDFVRQDPTRHKIDEIIRAKDAL